MQSTKSYSGLMVLIAALIAVPAMAQEDAGDQKSPAPETEAAAEATPVPAPTPSPEPTPRPIEGIEPVTTESGLKYWDIKAGEGETPRSGAKVTVDYTGWLKDGTMFDSSVTKGRPFKFRTNTGVIQGWLEGISTMKAGGIRRLEIPADMAYGKQARGKIPADADLIFEIELISIDEQGPEKPSTEGIEPTTTESGVKYWDIEKGEGESPSAIDRIKMDYSGWVDSGRLAWSSFGTGRPFDGPMSAMPEGWAEGVRSMKAGGRRVIAVPAALAFGERGSQGIPPNSDMLFDVHLLEVKKPPKQTSVEGIEPVTTDSGLKYWDIKEGEGESPQDNSSVTVHYTGWLQDGTMFDSSVEKGQPFTFRMSGGVIKGWIEGAKTMKVGGKRRLEIPPDLAYGERGFPPVIPPNSTLIFEIEVIGVETPDAPKAPEAPKAMEAPKKADESEE